MLKYNLGQAFPLLLSRLLPSTALSALGHQTHLPSHFYSSIAPIFTHYYFCLELFPPQFYYNRTIILSYYVQKPKLSTKTLSGLPFFFYIIFNMIAEKRGVAV